LECVQGFRLAGLDGGLVEDSLVDGIGDRVVDEFTKDQTVCRSASALGAQYTPLHSSNSCIVSVGMGKMCPISLSLPST
jgi:hypothetical protein